MSSAFPRVKAPTDLAEVRAISAFGLDVCGTLDLADVQHRCVRRLASLIPGTAHGATAHLGEYTGGGDVPVRPVHRGSDNRMLAAYPGMARDPFLQCAYRTRDPVHDRKLFRDSRWLRDSALGRLFVEYGFRHGLVIPVSSGPRLLGHMFVLRDTSMPAFDEREVGLTREVGRWTNVAFANAMTYEGSVHGSGVRASGEAKSSRVEDVSSARRAPSLTQREHDVLELVARGLRDAEIAGALTISANTVKHHLKNIYRKLGAQSRTDAVWIASTNGSSLGLTVEGEQ